MPEASIVVMLSGCSSSCNKRIRRVGFDQVSRFAERAGKVAALLQAEKFAVRRR